jgi:hypothetical protein
MLSEKDPLKEKNREISWFEDLDIIPEKLAASPEAWKSFIVA